jgi:hypothetical protein
MKWKKSLFFTLLFSANKKVQCHHQSMKMGSKQKGLNEGEREEWEIFNLSDEVKNVS